MARSGYFDALDTDNNIVHRLYSQLQAQGYDDAEAEDIAVAKAAEHGNFDKAAMDLTAQGRERSAMGAAGRAIDRAATTSGRAASDYRYNPRTNRATLKTPPSRRGGGGGRPIY